MADDDVDGFLAFRALLRPSPPGPLPPNAYRCPYEDCGRVSYNTNDFTHGFCGACGRWKADKRCDPLPG